MRNRAALRRFLTRHQHSSDRLQQRTTHARPLASQTSFDGRWRHGTPPSGANDGDAIHNGSSMGTWRLSDCGVPSSKCRRRHGPDCSLREAQEPSHCAHLRSRARACPRLGGTRRGYLQLTTRATRSTGYLADSMPAKLVFARDAVTIAIHLRTGAVCEKVMRLLAGSHLPAACSAVAVEPGGVDFHIHRTGVLIRRLAVLERYDCLLPVVLTREEDHSGNENQQR